MKKIISFLILFTILLINCTSIFAATSTETVEREKTVLELVDESSCDINLDDAGSFNKKMTNFNAENKELTITLTVTNTSKAENISKPVELYLILDNSHSMSENYNNQTKKSHVIQTATAFVNSLFDHFTNPKVGIISFSSIDTTKESSDAKLGTTADATLLLKASDSLETVKNAISAYETSSGIYTNIDAGLTLAQSNFTTDANTNKYIVLLSDGVPNLSLDTENTLTYSGVNATNTKAKLQALESQGYNIFSILMGLNQNTLENPSAPLVSETGKHMTYGQLAEEIFGTQENPTVGDFYFIDYADLNNTINEKIYGAITAVKSASLKNIVVKDYIPQDILNNFDYEVSVKPNIGTVSDTVDATDNSITWTIPELKEDEVATLSYTLKVKANVQKDVIDKVLPTNEKVDVDFETPDGKGTASSDVSPKVKLTTVTVTEPVQDNTVAEENLPQTGIYTTLMFISIISIAIYAITRYIHLNKIK